MWEKIKRNLPKLNNQRITLYDSLKNDFKLKYLKLWVMLAIKCFHRLQSQNTNVFKIKKSIIRLTYTSIHSYRISSKTCHK